MNGLNLTIDDCIHYGAHGVCRVRGKEQRQVGREKRNYYCLSPVGQEGICLYVPENGDPEKLKLRGVLTAEEIQEMLLRVPADSAPWIPDSKLRRETYSRILRDGDIPRLIQMARGLYVHMGELAVGKTLTGSDMEALRSAEKQIYSEFSFVLGMERSAVRAMIFGDVIPGQIRD